MKDSENESDGARTVRLQGEARELGMIYGRMRYEASETIKAINRPGWVKDEFARLLDQKIDARIKREKNLQMAQATQSVRLRHENLRIRTRKFR